MELEDNPEKKLRLAKLVETYTAQAQAILDEWEEKNKRAEKATRNVKLILWLTVLFTLSFVFPVNIILVILFAVWFYRNYLRSSRIAQLPKSTASQSLVTDEESYEDWLTEKIVTLNKDKCQWTEDVLAKYDSLDEIAAGIGKIDEIDKEAGKKILHRYQAILADIEKLPDSDQKTYYLDFHREMIADLENVFEQLHIV